MVRARVRVFGVMFFRVKGMGFGRGGRVRS